MKYPKRIFDLGKFQVVHKAVKNLTSIVNKGQNRRDCSNVTFPLVLIVFQGCKLKEKMSPTMESILDSMEGEIKI